MEEQKSYKGKSYKKFALTAAKELFYSKDVIQKIKNAKTDEEIDLIMHDARNGLY